MNLTHLRLLALVSSLAFTITYPQDITWEQMTNGISTTCFVYTLTVNKAGHIFAGVVNGGVYRSTNNGQAWTAVNNGLVVNDVRCLTAAPNGHLFAAVWKGGIYRSTNNGDAWEKFNNFPETSATDTTTEFVGVSWAPNTANSIFAGCYSAACISQDEGTTWKRLSSVGVIGTFIKCVAVNPQGHLFITSVGSGIYRSINDAQTWELVGDATLPDAREYNVVVSPVNNNLFVNVLPLGVFRSENNGDSWILTNKTPLMGANLALIISRQGTLFLGGPNGGGVYSSSDNGGIWKQNNNGLLDASIYALTIDSAGYLYAGSQTGGIFRSKSQITPLTTTIGKTPNASGPVVRCLQNRGTDAIDVQFTLAKSAFVSLAVFNTCGKRMASLVNGFYNQGTYTALWDKSVGGNGVYVIRLRSGTDAVIKKGVLP